MELVKLESPELEVIEKSKADQIKDTFLPMANKIKEFENDYNDIIKSSNIEITEDLTKKAKRLRLDISKIRIETEKIRKEQKEEYLRAGKAIDGVSNIVKWAIHDKEKSLKEIEDHFELLEAKRLEELQLIRAEELSKYVDDAEERKLNEMDEDVWFAYLETKKKEYNDKIEAEKKAEQDRIAKEKEEQKERERVKKENERLKKEAELKEKRNAELRPYIVFIRDYDKLINMNENDYKKSFYDIKKSAQNHWEDEKEQQIKKQKEEEKAKKEREQLAKKLKEEKVEKEKLVLAEKLKRQKLEAELKAKEDAERKDKEQKELRVQEDLKKSDKAKVIDLINDLDSIKSKYVFKAKKNQKMYSDVSLLIDKVINHINK